MLFLLALIQIAYAQLVFDGVVANCGSTNIEGVDAYKAWEQVYICLVFDDVKG